MKPLVPSTEPATLDGTLTHASSAAAAHVWKLRVVYAAKVGIVHAAPVIWDERHPLVLGRGGSTPDSGAWLAIQDDRVSRQHARIFSDGAQVLVEDLHSKNGSALGGVRLAPGVPQPLSDGDVLRIGDSFLILRHEPQLLRDAAVATFVGVSRGACQVRDAIARSAASDRPLLILGETGTGKEVVAQSIHALSRRRGRLVAVNCAAIPATLAESQLFGVARGAFTGAIERGGFFTDADRGTLFLDELGELPVEVQPKLLRALETREILPVGGRDPIVRDVRILAATNRDLTDAIRERRFREDLYARLAADVLQLPPLRERREDILPLAQHLTGMGDAFSPSPRLVAALLGYAWPRNVRELGHVARRLSDHSEEEVLRSLPATPPPGTTATATAAATAPAESAGAAARWQAGDPIPSRERVTALLTQHRGNLTSIEAQYGYSRRQFRRWVESYGIDLAPFRQRPVI